MYLQTKSAAELALWDAQNASIHIWFFMYLKDSPSMLLTYYFYAKKRLYEGTIKEIVYKPGLRTSIDDD